MANDFLDKYSKKSESVTQSIDISSNSPKIETPKPQTDTMSFTQNSGFTAPPKVQKQKQNKKFPIMYAVIPVVLIAIVTVLVLIFTGGTTLPNMEGWTKTEAELWANENNIILRTEFVFSDEIDSSKIISQSPKTGEKIKKGEFLELEISSGPDYDVTVVMPDIMKMTAKQVEAWASENYMEKVRVTYAESSTVEAGSVISFTVNDNSVIGDEVKRSSAVYVVFSSGASKGEPVEVPDFTSMTVEQAQTFAEEKEILLTLNYEFNDKYAQDEIFKQSIKAKETVNSGDTVVLSISKGKEILVPNFSDYSRDTVELQANKLGITLVIEERYSGYSQGTLLSQSIQSGSLYDGESFVKLVYSLGNKFDLPSFIGQDVTAINSWVSEFNSQGASISVKTTYTSSDKNVGTILSQDKENVEIGVSSIITVIVSQGPVIYAPSLVQAVGSVYADIMTREKVIEICNEIGIIPVFIEENSKDRLEGEVWYQSIGAGVEIHQGDTIKIKYVPVKSAFILPDFSGMTVEDIQKDGFDKQFSITYTVGEYVENMDNKVISQSIAKNTTVASGTAITLEICPEKEQ